MEKKKTSNVHAEIATEPKLCGLVGVFFFFGILYLYVIAGAFFFCFGCSFSCK